MLNFQPTLHVLLLTGLAISGCVGDWCKSFPGDVSWPTGPLWQGLNETLDGRLLSPRPPGGPCHPGYSSGSGPSCAEVQEEWQTGEWHTSDPVSVMWDQFSNYTCLPDPSTSCSVEGYPAFVVNATDPTHVMKAFDFGECRRQVMEWC